jgi:hypothetical protein
VTALVNELRGWMAAPNYDQGSCCVYEGWRFGSVRRKTRRWRKVGSKEIGREASEQLGRRPRRRELQSAEKSMCC